MKLAISSDQGRVSAHFGRCPSYTIVEIDAGQVLRKKEIPNPGHQPGFLPEFLAEKNVNCIIAGGMGPRAQGLFAQKNIETILGVQGDVDEIIERFINQEIEAGDDLCNHGHGPESHSPCEHHPEELRQQQKAGARVCISSEGAELGADMDPKFGRARYFLIVDPFSMDFEVLENPNTDAPHGAGILTAQLIASKNVGTVLTGNCGPNALKVLQASGIDVRTNMKGKVGDVLSEYRSERG